jgi:hypothetical protein
VAHALLLTDLTSDMRTGIDQRSLLDLRSSRHDPRAPWLDPHCERGEEMGWPLDLHQGDSPTTLGGLRTGGGEGSQSDIVACRRGKMRSESREMKDTDCGGRSMHSDAQRLWRPFDAFGRTDGSVTVSCYQISL